MKIMMLFFTFISFFNCTSQTKPVENRNVVHYFKEVKSLEFKERNKQNLTIDSVTIATKYLDTITHKLNPKGFELLQEIKEKVLDTYYQDYLFLQHINYNNKSYTLYFTMLSLYDIEFIVFTHNETEWNYAERINRKLADSSKYIIKLQLNYEEIPKNMIHEAAIFVKKNYLVFDLGGLFLCSFNFSTNKLMFEEENPYKISQLYDKEANKKWVLENIHQKINNQIND